MQGVGLMVIIRLLMAVAIGYCLFCVVWAFIIFFVGNYTDVSADAFANLLYSSKWYILISSWIACMGIGERFMRE
jgi:hypothetical protein